MVNAIEGINRVTGPQAREFLRQVGGISVSGKASERQRLSWTLVKTAPGWRGGEEFSK